MTALAPAAAPVLPFGRLDGLRFGLLGLPLAFVALPLYVLLPAHYAATYGMPLAALGAVLLATRALDAVLDPLIGRWVDRLFARSAAAAWRLAALGAVLVGAGFCALFFPVPQGGGLLLGWLAAGLAVTYLGYSAVSIVHQAWGARLGGDAGQRARVVAWREAAALVGVLLASVLPSLAGLGWTAAALVALLAAGLALLRSAPQPAAGATSGHTAAAPARPWQGRAFPTLLTVFVVNGIAGAIPATLVLFFVRDRLQAGPLEPLFLAAYFACAALSVPLWVRLVARLGLVRAWLAGMLLAVAAFAATPWLGAGDSIGFFAVCAATGAALGADLVVPGALLAGVVQRAAPGSGPAEGTYFGWWNAAAKLNLALAAGASLPLLGWAGYAPGATDPAALQALVFAYAGLPCVLKLAAAALLASRHHLLGETK